MTEARENGPPARILPRHITILVVISVATQLVLAVAFVAALFFLIGRIHDSQLTSCRNSNSARVQDIAIWNRLLRISPAQRAKETQAQRAEVVDLKRLVKRKDSPVNCRVLYRTGF